MKTTSFLLICLALILVTSCSDKGIEPIQTTDIEAKLIGNWLWLESCGGIDGKCLRPPYIGKEGLSFDKDGKSFYWRDDGFPSILDYKIEQKTSLVYRPDTIVTVIVFISESVVIQDLIIKQLDDSGLTVIEDCIDCYESVYSKTQ